MTLTRDHLRRIVLVAHAPEARFVELVGMAELDPATAFRGAIMRGADLRREDLSGFDFTGANFAGADLSEADLSLTIGLTTDMLVGAHYNARTRFPAYLPDPFWAPEQRATWADDWGTDQYGRWVSFSVPAAEGTLVTQRMRWIPPGSFLRGSPNDKPGRNDDEGRRREVTIADGFWLFDTPCTQALWQAVMGDNPSRFQSPTRPVEQVSFHDAQAFVTKLNALKPGLSLDLPSEARWEYACRAGTVEATYAGGMQILGEYNAPVLDAIAWYGGNSGVGFELDNGYYSGDWPGKQYEHTRAGTHPVGQKVPNQWGLHDMLGNVWEWCADHWHGSYTGAPDDGSAWLGRRGAAFRVVRGGSWGVGARVVRAARRNRVDPALRAGNLGFRCARVQGNSEAPAAKRRAGRSKPRERSERAATTSPKRPR